MLVFVILVRVLDRNTKSARKKCVFGHLKSGNRAKNMSTSTDLDMHDKFAKPQSNVAAPYRERTLP